MPEVSRISVLSSGRCHGSNVSMPFGGQTAAEKFGAGEVARIGGEQRGREIGPEPRDEEHHLRGDEQDHAVAVRDLHDAGVVALVLGFVDDVAPPGEHGVEHADRAGREQERRGREQLVHPGDQSDREQQGRDRADDRPRARVHEMVVVVLGVRVGHFSSLRSPLGRARASWSPISLRDPQPALPVRASRRTNRTA